MSAKRKEIASLSQEAKAACRRPLFTEIVLGGKNEARFAADVAVKKEEDEKVPDASNISSRDALSETDSLSSSFPGMKKPLDEAAPQKPWRQILLEASQLLPYMTEEEHGDFFHLASIFLLGFLVPHSTGNEFFLLQHMPENDVNSENTVNSNDDIVVNYILYMDLEERLEATCRHYSACAFGELETLTDANWELAFDTFVRQGLAPFLGGRPAHLHQVDLLHIIAMTIHPQPSETFIPDTAAYLDEKPCWLRCRKLMGNRHAHSFQVNYEHRLKLVQLVIHYLVIPSYDPEAPILNCPLFDGAVSHLRVALHAFALGALSQQDAFLARSALVSISTQVGMKVVAKEEFDFLLHRLVDDRNEYPGCHCCSQILREQRFGYFQKQWTISNGNDAKFCPHAARGCHLAEFFIRICQSRHSGTPISDDFLIEAFSSITDAIEWQMHCWKKSDDPAEESDDSEEPPCMLASLLFAVKACFYFLLPSHEQNTSAAAEEDESDEVGLAARRDELVSCAIQLAHHFHPAIASEAAELLSVAFAYGSKTSVEGYIKPLFCSLRLVLSGITGQSQHSLYLESSLRGAVSAASRLSPAFALSCLNEILKQLNDGASKLDTSDHSSRGITAFEVEERPRRQELFLLKLISNVVLANPVIVAEKVPELLQLMGQLADKSSQLELLTVLISCRQSRFFEKKDDPGELVILEAAKNLQNRWTLYQLGRHALRSGNFATAVECYKQILDIQLSENYFMWISSLSKLASAELCLSLYAAKGMPSATTLLQSTVSILHSLSALTSGQSRAYAFCLQINLLKLRLDFLDLLTALRQLIREMRVSGSGPAKRTRSFLHFQNITKCLDALANRYLAIYKQYGLFICQQSRTCLRTNYSISRFVARSMRVVFPEMLGIHSNKATDGIWPGNGPSGDLSLPISRFMKRLEERLLQRMSPALSPAIRAAAMLEIIDGILLCPVPFPVDFLSVSVVPCGVLKVLADPEEAALETSDEMTTDVMVNSYPGLSFDLFVHGEIPASLVAKAKLPVHEVLVWHGATYLEAIAQDDLGDEKQDDEHMTDEKPEEDTPTVMVPRPWQNHLERTRLQTNGKFQLKIECPPIREEGTYEIELKLGCRDIRGGQWEIRLDGKESVTKVNVQVSRSREQVAS